MAIILKTPDEIEKMRKSGLLAATVMQRIVGFIHPHLTTLQVDKFINSQIKSFHAKPSFIGQDGYEFSSCISINAEVVHGLPSEKKIKKGDVVSIDLGVLYEGYHSDMCKTVEVGASAPGNKRFLEAGVSALNYAISQCKPGNRVGDISHSLQKIIEENGYFVVYDLVGHGIGKNLHEEPQIPCYGKVGTGPELLEGMVIAIEVMYTKTNSPLEILSDGWTFATQDKSLSAMFEHTVAITKNGCEVLTKL
ncbi:type I methionyl aminopeptidase [candidate division WWE3 bacterium CG09_land_8_20_14_0_10_39_24]|uniref:Methionine aminopeptidase n=1 Tax=candidate division WWE3 bacterium CG09_land_8_20_14_0_10_39_24 TaxID=1975088 RepID=A0A2H0WJG1_UNCKA|nr:MAG: type I methionyl aminopeptidase [candidate division WWE3 bacterium CG09_land_8_20_14_0_10_39_24]